MRSPLAPLSSPRCTGSKSWAGTTSGAPPSRERLTALVSEVRALRGEGRAPIAHASFEAKRANDAPAMLTLLAELATEHAAAGHALLAKGDPSGRAVLEDAGTCFEELGDEAAVLAIDAALREAEATIEESPRSFQA